MQVKKYFEKKVSLLSTSDVRYDGELYTVDPTEQSIALKHVNCMGTEGRKSGDQAIAPSDCTYEFIIFRAVNIRKLWIDTKDGRRDLTDEILIPLRSGQSVNTYEGKNRQDSYDEPPKRKVGYQSRSSQQQQQGYDPYYSQPPPRGYDNYGYRGGYNQPPPNQYPVPPPYYDSPGQGYYYNQQGGSAAYRQPRQAYHGYRQRAPQYYNAQQRSPAYYNQGYQQYGYVNQSRRRYGQGRNYGGYDQGQRGYQSQRYNYSTNPNRGSRGQNRQGGGRRETNQAGTGAFLDNRRLRGDEIDVQDQQDFDFGAAKNEFDQTKSSGDAQANGSAAVDDTQANGAVKQEDAAEKEDQEKAAAAAASASAAAAAAEKGDEEETKQDEADSADKKYDKSKSFFDGLQTETKKSKPRQDLQAQKDVDTKTFGSVAATYKSRHINRSGQGRYNQNYRYNTQQNRRYAQQQDYQTQPRQRSSYNQRVQQSQSYSTNRWVVRR